MERSLGAGSCGTLTCRLCRAGVRWVKEPALTSRTPRLPGLAWTIHARARDPGLAERGFPADVPCGPAGRKGRQGTALYTQSRRALPGVLRPGIVRYAQPRRALSKELRQGKALFTQPRRAVPREERQRPPQCPQPKQLPVDGRPDLLTVGFSPVIEAGGKRLEKA